MLFYIQPSPKQGTILHLIVLAGYTFSKRHTREKERVWILTLALQQQQKNLAKGLI